jgi:hypothetical protein
MKRKSSLIGLAALALLMASAVPVAAERPTPTLYTVDFSCTSTTGNPATMSTVLQRKDVHQ